MKKIQTNLIWIVLVLALILRIPLLNGSFWLDEAAQALESARPFSQQLEIVPDFQPPLLHYMVHFSLLVSSSEWWLRLIAAVIPGLITIAVSYDLGRRLFNRSVGLVTALLLATNSFHIFYSQELRPYALPAMWAVIGWWLVYVITQRVKTKIRSSWLGSNKVWVGFAVVSVLGIYTSYLYPFLLFAQLVWLLVSQPQQWRRLLITVVIIGLCFVPWLPMFRQQLAAGGELRTALPGWSTVVSVPQLKSLPLVFGKFVFGVMNVDINALFVIVSTVLVALGGLAFLSNAKNWWSKHTSKLWLLLVWLVIPLVSAWLVSFFIPVVQPKRVLYLLPSFYLLIASIAVEAKRKLLTVALIGTVLLINVVGTAEYYTNPQYQRENWRGAYQTLINRYPADQTVAVFVFPEPFAPWRWYNTQQVKSLSTGTLTIDQTTDLKTTLLPLERYRYVIVFDYLRDLTDPHDQIIEAVENFGFQPSDLLEYPNIGFIRIFTKKEFVSA